MPPLSQMINGFIFSGLTIIAGIIILIKPQLIRWVMGIFLLIVGIGALVFVIQYVVF